MQMCVADIRMKKHVVVIGGGVIGLSMHLFKQAIKLQ